MKESRERGKASVKIKGGGGGGGEESWCALKLLVFKSCGRCTYHDSLITQFDLIYSSIFGSKHSEYETKAIPFFSLFSVVQPTQIFAFSKKKGYAEGSEGNDTLFQTIVTFAFDFDNDVDFFFVHCRHETSPC